MGWDQTEDVRDVLLEYCRFFFGPDVAESAADGILALEKNWDGPLIQNGGVEATLGDPAVVRIEEHAAVEAHDRRKARLDPHIARQVHQGRREEISMKR